MAAAAAHDHVTGEKIGNTPLRPATSKNTAAVPVSKAGHCKSSRDNIGKRRNDLTERQRRRMSARNTRKLDSRLTAQARMIRINELNPQPRFASELARSPARRGLRS